MTKKMFAFAAFLMAIAAPAAFAQKDAPAGPQWMEVTKIVVRPEKVGEFHDWVKNEFNPALIKGGVKLQYAWHTGEFGDLFTYYFVSPIGKFADFDGDGPIEKALGRDAAGPFFAKAGTLVKSVENYAMAERPDMSYMGKMSGEPKMAVMITIDVAQGHDADFENFMINEYLPAFKRSDAQAFLVHQTVFGGRQGHYVMLAPIDNFAELDKGHPIARVLGQDGFRKLMQKLPAGTSTQAEVDVISFQPSLSIMPAGK